MKTQDSIVDPECKLQNVEVFCDTSSGGGKPYGCTLNFTSVTQNSNKFYIIQLLKDVDSTTSTSTTATSGSSISSGGSTTIGGTCKYHVFTRYGRITEIGTSDIKTFDKQNLAVSYFLKKFADKTSNSWSTAFKPKPNKYFRLEMAEIDVTEETVADARTNVEQSTALTLEPSIEKFISDISDKKVHMETIANFNIDMTKMPLGKISDKQIDSAYIILGQLNDIVMSIKSGDWKKSAALLDFPETYIRGPLVKYSNDFWRLVPCNCKRSETPPIIDTEEQILKLTELLEIIKNTEISGKITRRFNNVHDIYKCINVNISLIPDSQEVKLLENLIYKTRGDTHYYGIEIVEMFRLQKSVEIDKDDQFFNSISNHRMLIHGSRKANYMSILSMGLRLPHVNQVSNGSTLGRGIYFADVSTKSFNYCGVESHADCGYLLLCEVALGDFTDLRQGPSFDTPLLKGQTSRWGLGKMYMEDESYVDMNTTDGFVTPGAKIPQGPLCQHHDSVSSFLYNEYVIFDPRQYRFRYLVKIKKLNR